MTPADHAFQARRLIDANHGTSRSAELCRVSAGQLSRYRDERYGEFMAPDVIFDLQMAAHTTSYSDALKGVNTQAPGDLKDDVCISVEDVSAILSAVRQKTGASSPRVRDALHKLVAAVRDDLAKLDQDIDASGVLTRAAQAVEAGNVSPIR